MTISREAAVKLAEAYTAAWNTGSFHAVAEFFTAQGGIVINGGEPWPRRRQGVEPIDRVVREFCTELFGSKHFNFETALTSRNNRHESSAACRCARSVGHWVWL